ncbi:MAG: 2-oxoglutarate dehydrogenase E1 component, partial [Legionellales bacterium]|nr:2-oxoglutarate dehydrogenase E1 component [Legionellales bacterium]
MFKNNLELQKIESHLSGENQTFIEYLYEIYLSEPNTIPKEWREYFNSISKDIQDVSHSDIVKQFKELPKLKEQQHVIPKGSKNVSELNTKITKLINAYRLHGHHHAELDPLNIAERKIIKDLSLEHHGLSNDLDSKVEMPIELISPGSTVEELYNSLNNTYSDTIGVEFLHITDNEQTEWIERRLEKLRGKPKFTNQEKKYILKQLTAAEGLEKYLGTKYVGQKRFSLEGAESFIPAINSLIARAGSIDVKEIIIGMAHRGRLNVLVNVLGKSPESLFEEFEGKFAKDITGDVKYHMGFSADVEVPTGQVVHLGLAFNPSHLEIISPVVGGSVRARQRRRDDLNEHQAVVPVLIHGDAAIAGQGVVMETMNFSQARGYSVGGTIHLIINNQIGFTTSNPLDARSTLYCSDIAKIIQAPIFHVNADDPEAVLFITKIAFDFRMKFNKDVVIDLVCYRRHGHNEADDPSITQPQMYKAIRSMESIRAKYAKELISSKILSNSDVDSYINEYRSALDKGESIVKSLITTYVDEKALNWVPYLNKTWQEQATTSLSMKKITDLHNKLIEFPKDFKLHSTVSKVINARTEMAKGNKLIDWGFAETIAYASLLDDGYGIRISG